MKIEHVALWTRDLERVKLFYETYFHGMANKKYVNPKTQFESYFMTFVSGGGRLELMSKPGILPASHDVTQIFVGFAHIAFSVGSQDRVDTLTAQLEREGFTVVSRPRTTGDGYYESCVLDPDGNHVEITI